MNTREKVTEGKCDGKCMCVGRGLSVGTWRDPFSDSVRGRDWSWLVVDCTSICSF